ncbi:sensor domain-containing diguanylate cyclase [Paenibacillus sp. PL2-23]|uniref:sensor domain-containing diguanylate cyclase n=1 Tax=Paenibacillus sp. PL2-23 TaxID=2100729 RepID=UPI0030FB7935
MMKKPLSLTSLLAGLVVLSLGLSTLFQLFFSYRSQQQSLTETTLLLNYANADKVSHSIDSLFVSMRSSLRVTANYLSQHEELTDQGIQQQLELIRSTNLYFNSLSWVDETGLIRNIAPITVGLKGVQLMAGETTRALEAQKPYLSVPYVAQTGRLIVLMSEPMYDQQGIYRGIIAGTIYLQESNVVNKILGYNKIDSTGSYYYVVGPKGYLLFHPEEARIGENVSVNPFVQQLMQGREGYGEVTNSKGTEMLAAYSFMEETGWGVVMQTPVAHVDEQLGANARMNLLYILPAIMVLLALALYMARRLSMPFVLLSDLMDNLISGKDVTRPDKRIRFFREAAILSDTVEIAIDTVKEKNNKLMQEATIDKLTGLQNRRALDEAVSTLSRSNVPFSLILADIDFFKSVNDTYGHSRGDDVLSFLAGLLKGETGDRGSCFRYGGEEFVVLLPDAQADGEAYQLAERIRAKVMHTISPIGRPVTLSLGIAEYPRDAASVEDLLERSDHALYRSKAGGRNRTTVAGKADGWSGKE